ncbi:MAG: alpha-amylase/4-alpha-glucanotransferase domain-containing protein, partial [Chloroflexota bacterium]
RGAAPADLDMDGRTEAILSEPGQVVTVKPSEGAGIGAWDIRAARHAMTSVLRRRPEAYHQTLRDHDAKVNATDAAEAEAAAPGADGAVTSIHDIVMVKEEGLAAHLHYDTHERRTGLVRFLEPGVTPQAFADAGERELADFRDGEWQMDHLAPGQVSLSRNGNVLGQPVGISKTIRLGSTRLDPALTVELEVIHRGSAPVEARLGLELSLHLLGGGGNPQAWYDVAGSRSAHDGTGQAAAVEAIGYGNDWIGVAIEARPTPAADAWWSPIETISNSEAGFERVYQGSSLLFSWPVRLEPGETRRFAVTQQVAVGRDRAAEETGAGD